jgi:hypothetical protein
MNEKLQNYAREELRTGLAQLPETWQRTFKLMYGRDNGKRSVEAAIALSIDDVVSSVPEDKLDWAMQQVENSLQKLATKENAK